MFKNVVVGSDPRSGGRDALALAVGLTDEHATIVVARVYNAELELTVPEEPVIPEVGIGDRHVRTEMVPATTPGHGLHRLARRVGADLVIVGSSTRGMWERLVFGDDVRQCVRNAPCAVAIAPEGYAEHAGAFVKVGVGWDGGPAAHAALDAARDIAKASDGTVEALEVIAMPTPMLAPGTYAHVSVESDVERAQERLAAIEGATARARLGVPEEELARWSRDLDLLAVGATGHGRLGRLLLGSTPEQLTRSVAAPLLVVPPADEPTGPDVRHASASSPSV